MHAHLFVARHRLVLPWHECLSPLHGIEEYYGKSFSGGCSQHLHLSVYAVVLGLMSCRRLYKQHLGAFGGEDIAVDRAYIDVFVLDDCSHNMDMVIATKLLLLLLMRKYSQWFFCVFVNL